MVSLPLTSPLSRRHSRGRLTARQPGLPLALLVSVTGNSHSIGRDTAQGGDVFAANVRQWTQEGTLAFPAAAILDVGDTSGNTVSTMFSVQLTFLNALSAARSYAALVVVVANGQSSTGFVDGTWKAGSARLATAKDRFNAAYKYLIDNGYNVEVAAAVHLSSQPDFDISDTNTVLEKAAVYAENIDGYVDYIRQNFSGVSSATPIIISAAMTLTQITALGTNEHAFSSAGNGVYRRKAFTWFVDPINDWGDGETANLPPNTARRGASSYPIRG